MYRERPSRVAGAVAWTSTDDDAADHVRVLPDGCIDLIWDGHQMLVAGPDTRAHLFSRTAGTTLVAVRFAPGFGPRVLAVPAGELTDRRLLLDELWTGGDMRRLTDAVHTSTRPAAVIERTALERSRLRDDDGLVDHVVVLARRGAAVADIADVVGLSDRQLQRRCLDAFGYGAKTLAKILRMSRALALARDGRPFADTAIESGYADQAHLARDVKQLAGVNLRRLLPG